ncbi:hypothetical protein BL254_22730 [Protofrankia sp. BMG5.30]|uniref:Uncharacterized protein n=2 Tax=Protofrankia TaxID=2994361 RepID=A0ABR5EZ65_9ACTN|nr:hypothetical protein FrCorBMG51_22660 [Protofrankia coriariae]ONH31787.1 hypothetical protein BL254_22730 [Protofrankia sp. BMG5.30]
MWAYYSTGRAKGRTPTGTDLDRIAGTNNYGRKVPPRAGRNPTSWDCCQASGSRDDKMVVPTGLEPVIHVLASIDPAIRVQRDRS